MYDTHHALKWANEMSSVQQKGSSSNGSPKDLMTERIVNKAKRDSRSQRYLRNKVSYYQNEEPANHHCRSVAS